MADFTRFLFHSSEFAAQKVRHSAFMPPKKSLKKSISVIEGLTEAEIWEDGRLVESLRTDEAQLKARADFSSQVVADVGLDIEYDRTPYPRHANLIGWPEDKDERQAKAQRLADAAGKAILLPQKG